MAYSREGKVIFLHNGHQQLTGMYLQQHCKEEEEGMWTVPDTRMVDHRIREENQGPVCWCQTLRLLRGQVTEACRSVGGGVSPTWSPMLKGAEEQL